jgi:hypothetical protein
VPIRWGASLGVLLVLVLGACGSDSSGPTGSGTHLEIDGVATLGPASVAPDPNAEPGPIPDGNATEVNISGTLDCDGRHSTGTGMFQPTAVEVCFTVDAQAAVFDQVGVDDADVDVACAEVFGGPQHATIKGVIRGKPVDVKVERTNSCGIQDWQRLEFLLGPPER